MALFSDVLLTVDYDRTLTGPDSVVPERNWEAIRYFMENGGAFTINTGRSTTTMRDLLYTFPASMDTDSSFVSMLLSLRYSTAF